MIIANNGGLSIVLKRLSQQAERHWYQLDTTDNIRHKSYII